MLDELTPELMREALDTLRLARKISTRDLMHASYRAPVQTVFDILDAEEKAD